MMIRLALASAALLAASLQAEKIDLGRTEPVPSSQPIPVQDFFRPAQLWDPRINEAGTHIAALISRDDKTELLIWDIAHRRAEVANAYGDLDVANPQWLDDRHVEFGLTSEKYFNFATMVATVGDVQEAYPIFQFCGSVNLWVPLADRAHPLYWLSAELINTGDRIFNRQGPVVSGEALRPASVGIVNPDQADNDWTTAVKVVQNNDEHIYRRYPPVPGVAAGYLADREGRLSIGVNADENGIAHVFRFSDGAWIPCPIDLDRVEILGPGDDPGQLVVLGPRTPGQPRALRFMDAATGALGDVLIQDDQYDFDGTLYRDAASHRIVGATYDRQAPTQVWFSEGYRRLQRMLDAFFSGRRVRIVETDARASVILVSVYSDRQPPWYYSVDLAHHQVGLIQKSAPWIDPQRMSPMKILRFRTRDGIVLDAYLTLPPGASPEHPVPLIVYPHGGPFYRDKWGFQGDVQFLASRGYAVLQPNYRNSVGYQWRAPEADLWDFAKMSDDVTDATRAMLATGLVDPRRVAIVGGSFGGFLAVSGVAHEPSLYRCAVTIAGVFNWTRMVKDAKWNQFDSPQYVALKRHLGDPKANRAWLAAMSPINFVSQIKVPVFVYHGEDDRNVPIAQSRALVSALTQYGVPHETMFVSGEGHGPRHLDNEVEMWERIETFLNQHL